MEEEPTPRLGWKERLAEFDAFDGRYKAWTWGLGGLVMLALSSSLNDTAKSSEPIRYLGAALGFFGLTVATWIALSGLYSATFGRDVTEVWPEERFSKPTQVLDTERTMHGGQIALALVGAELLAVVNAALIGATCWEAELFLEIVEVKSPHWATALRWGGGGVAFLAVVIAVVAAPLMGLWHWFGSRRAIEAQRLAAFKTIAAEASKTR